MRSTKIIQGIVVSLIAVLCLTPLASVVLPLPHPALRGVELNYAIPRWSLKNFLSNHFQGKVELWATRGHPLWGWSVKLVNEITYSLFGEVSLDYGTSVQRGHEDFLWQPMYLRSFNRLKPPPRRVIDSTFAELKTLQDFLATKQIPLIAMIEPNLIALYPELLPERFRAVRPHESSYEVAQRAILRTQSRVLDTFQLLTRAQPHFPIRFFAPTGSHWNEVGSCLAAREVAAELATAWTEQIPAPTCEQYTVAEKPQPAELDLVEIANFIWPEKLYRPTPYLLGHVKPVLKKPRKILLVGTSFLFGIERQLLQHGIAQSTTLLFYFRQSRKNGEGNFRSFDRKKFTASDILSYDAIIVDANVAGPGVLGYGFLPLARSRFDLPAPVRRDKGVGGKRGQSAS